MNVEISGLTEAQVEIAAELLEEAGFLHDTDFIAIGVASSEAPALRLFFSLSEQIAELERVGLFREEGS